MRMQICEYGGISGWYPRYSLLSIKNRQLAILTTNAKF